MSHAGHSHRPLGADVASVLAHRLVWGVAALLALATVVGLVVLWPSGDADTRAEELGLSSERYRARVSSVVLGDCPYTSDNNPARCRTIEVVPSEGPDEGIELPLGFFDLADPSAPTIVEGDRIVIGYEEATGVYFYADQERRPALTWLLVLFVVAVVALGRLRGVLALAALAATVGVLVGFVVPAVLDGRSPVLVAVVGAGAVAYVALYVTHGVNLMTTVALLGTLTSLGLTLLLGVVFFDLASFTGAATEDALYLPAVADQVDVRGLILGGVIFGALGALDDVVITQAATVWELRALDPLASTRRVWSAAMRVGREHTGSIINTLLLAYAGASMPLLVLFVLTDQSLGTVANSELVGTEIVRTLVGSIGLVAAVPITTGAAVLLTRAPTVEEPADG